MKTPKDEDTVELTGSASKKMKQARLPFKLLTTKVTVTKNKEENCDREKASSEKPCEDVMTDKKAKENANTDDVIVLEDSVDMTEEFENKSETEKAPTRSSIRKRSISVSPPKKVTTRKRQKTLKADSSTSENQEQAGVSKPVSPVKNSTNESKKGEDDGEEGEDVTEDKSEKEDLRNPSQKTKTLKRSASTLQDEDSRKVSSSKSKTEISKRESPRKKRIKGDEEVEEIVKKQSPRKKSVEEGEGDGENVKKESPKKKEVEENVKKESPKKKEVEENVKKESPKKKEVEENVKKESPKKKEVEENVKKESPKKKEVEENVKKESPKKKEVEENVKKESPRKKSVEEGEEDGKNVKKESPRKKSVKEVEEDGENVKKESPRKKSVKEGEEDGENVKKESPRKKSVKEGEEDGENVKKESPRKKSVKEGEEDEEDGENVKKESPRKKSVKKGEEDVENLKTESQRNEEDEEPIKDDDCGVEITKNQSPSRRQSSRIQSKMEENQDNESKQSSPSNETESPPERKEESEEKKGDGRIATPASANKTPKGRKLTPTQLEKQKESTKKRAEREEKLLEKERLKKEKEEQANKLKEERLKMKQDKEEQKKREREEKEELRKKEKEEKEKKRLAEIEQKNEVKRQKEEEKKKQTEAREEERRRRDEAKEEEKRKKDAEKRKAAEAFASFFKPKESNSAAAAEEGNDIEMAVDRTAVEQLKFMPFEVKGDMRLSTVCRRTLDPATKLALDEKMDHQNVDVSELYINLLTSKRHSPLSCEKTWPIADETDDDVIIIEAEVNEENGYEGTGKKVHKEKRTNRFKAKLLQFEENRRPPYWGTWRKKSANIGARNPFSLDKTIFEYDVDSDDEWEEEEPGESLRGSDDENEKESEDEYEVDNQVFVPHGYLSDEELQDDFEDCSREAQKAKLQLLEIEFQAEMTKKTEKLKPRLIGCVWFANSVSDPSSVGSRIAEMLLSRRMVLFGSEADLPIEARHRLSAANQESSSPTAACSPLVEQAGRKSKFPESAIPMLIKLVHGNQNKLSFLVREFSSYLTKNCQSTLDVPSMTAIRHKIRQLAKWMPFLAEDSATCPLAGKMCWYVGKDVREKYNLLLQDSELVTDPWKYILPAPRKSTLPTAILDQPSAEQPSPKSASITKFTKKMSEEERKKQLLQGTTDSSPSSVSSSSPSNAAGKKTPSCKPANLLATFVSLKGVPTKSSQDNDVIVISPDKPEQESGGGSTGHKKSTAAPKPPLVKKRVQLTTLSTFGVNSITKNVESSGVKIDDGSVTLNKESSSVKKDDSTLVTKESSSVKKGDETLVTKESSGVKKGDEPLVTKVSSSVKNDKNPSLSKNSNPQDCNSTPEPISKSPVDFLGFQTVDSTPGSARAGLLKTPESESRASKSIASFFTKGTNKTSAKKLFDRKQVVDESSNPAKSGASETTSMKEVADSTIPASGQNLKTVGESETCPKPLQNVDVPEGLDHEKSSEQGKINVGAGVGLSPHQSPAKKRVKFTTLSPPKWRVKLVKPLPPSSSSNDNNDEVIVLE